MRNSREGVMNDGGGLKEWEEVGPASLSSSHPQCFHGQRDWELLDDYDCSVFPPSSHEGLLIPTTEAADAVAEAASPPPPSIVDRGEDQDQDQEELPLRWQSLSNSRFLQLARYRLEFGFHHFYSKLLLFLRHRGAFPSAALLPSAVAAALVGVVFFVRRWRRRRQGLAAENNDPLLRLVREHDEVSIKNQRGALCICGSENSITPANFDPPADFHLAQNGCNGLISELPMS